MIQRSTPYIVPLILFIIGFSGVVLTIRGSLTGFQSLRWPSVQGKVLTAEPAQSPGSESANAWMPLVRYEYAVDGSPHRGAKLSIARPPSATKEKIESMLQAFAPGAAVEVFYNPDAPAESCLKPGPNYALFLAYLALSGAIFAVAIWWSRRIRDTINA